MSDVGPHLLGRRPSPLDPRDYPLALWLGASSPLEDALRALLLSRSSKTTKAWATIATPLILATSPTPVVPPPVPVPAGAVTWVDPEPVLDQGQTPHCVGFGGAQWGNTLPIDDRFTNPDGDALYYECKVIDGEPGVEDGSDVRSLAKALRNRGRLAAYAFAASVDEAVAWIRKSGPVIFGTDWTDGMFMPDSTGLVEATGAVAGGHCYLAYGYDPASDRIEFTNSWGPSWGRQGHFDMTVASMRGLFASNGEALAAVELPA